MNRLVASPSGAPFSASAKNLDNFGAGRSTVLIVDDNELMRQFAARIFTALEYCCIFAPNGVEALNQMRRHLVPVVLMDCQMPVLDGFDATRLIREWEHSTLTPKSTIIGCSSSGSRYDCLNAGMDAYIEKPLSAVNLRESLKKCFAVTRPIRQLCNAWN